MNLSFWRKNMGILYLLRHGESQANVDRIFAAKRINPPLTDKGIQQANAQAEALKQFSLSAIYASPLLRTQHTAEIVNKYHGLEIITSKDLYEIDVGALDGEDQKNPDYWDIYTDVMQKWSFNLLDVSFPDGESMIDVQGRLSSFIESIKDNADKSILIVGHCLLFMAFFWLFCENRGRQLNDNLMGRGHLSIVSFDKDKFSIEKFNIAP
jgi:broad specificity phosphatase PhoE